MYCPKCGNLLAEGAKFCPACGAKLEQAAPEMNQQPYAPVQPQSPLQNPQMNLPMNWYKFLIYFALFAGALINLVTGIRLLTGSVYGENRELIYLFLPSLHTVDIIMGLLTVAWVALAIYTRFQLAGWRKNGPSLLITAYIVNIVISVLYLIAVTAIVGREAEIDFSEAIGSIVGSVVMTVINYIYFKKRKAYFVR